MSSRAFIYLHPLLNPETTEEKRDLNSAPMYLQTKRPSGDLEGAYLRGDPCLLFHVSLSTI